MSIAEKLVEVAENQQRVYEAGYAAGYEAGAETGSGGNYDQGYTDGQKAEYDRFWDAYQQNGNRDHYVSAFAFLGWTDETYNPKYPITGGTLYGLQEVFRNSYIVDTKVQIINHGSNMNTTFNGCVLLERIPSLVLKAPVTALTNTFASCSRLKEINITCDGGCLAGNTNLQWSTMLNKASIESIISALSDTTTGLTLTLSDEAVTNAFNSTGEYPDGYGPEWEVLILSKPDWTISLP